MSLACHNWLIYFLKYPLQLWCLHRQELIASSMFARKMWRSLTGWILDGKDLSGFAWISDSSFVLGPDLELHLWPFVHIRHLKLSLFVWSLAALQPASSQLLLLLNHVPGKPNVMIVLNIWADFKILHGNWTSWSFYPGYLTLPLICCYVHYLIAVYIVFYRFLSSYLVMGLPPLLLGASHFSSTCLLVTSTTVRA